MYTHNLIKVSQHRIIHALGEGNNDTLGLIDSLIRDCQSKPMACFHLVSPWSMNSTQYWSPRTWKPLRWQRRMTRPRVIVRPGLTLGRGVGVEAPMQICVDLTISSVSRNFEYIWHCRPSHSLTHLLTQEIYNLACITLWNFGYCNKLWLFIAGTNDESPVKRTLWLTGYRAISFALIISSLLILNPINSI